MEPQEAKDLLDLRETKVSLVPPVNKVKKDPPDYLVMLAHKAHQEQMELAARGDHVVQLDLLDLKVQLEIEANSEPQVPLDLPVLPVQREKLVLEVDQDPQDPRVLVVNQDVTETQDFQEQGD